MYPSLLAALLYAFAASKASRYSRLTGAELSQNQQAPYLTLTFEGQLVSLPISTVRGSHTHWGLPMNVSLL